MTRSNTATIRRGRGSRRSRLPSVSVIVPARNEERNIAWVLEHMPLEVDEVILVDGRSTDRTIEVARAIRPDIVVVSDDAPGKGCAIRKGIETAKGDFVVMLDADGSMDPQEIGRFVRPLREGADVVRGSRFMAGGGTVDMSLIRKAGNWGFLVLTRILYGVARTDLCYGYAAFRRCRMLALDLNATGFEIEAQMFLRADRARFAVVEVPSFESSRRAGTSNLHTIRDGWRVLRTILRERVRPARPIGDVLPFQVVAERHRLTALGPIRNSAAAATPQQARVVRLDTDRRRRRELLDPDERAMVAALVWRLAMQQGDERLRDVALADYRMAHSEGGGVPASFAVDAMDVG